MNIRTDEARDKAKVSRFWCRMVEKISVSIGDTTRSIPCLVQWHKVQDLWGFYALKKHSSIDCEGRATVEKLYF